MKNTIKKIFGVHPEQLKISDQLSRDQDIRKRNICKI